MQNDQTLKLAKRMWGAYSIRAGGKTFDGKPLPNWDELGEDRQACWIAAAEVPYARIEQLWMWLSRAYFALSNAAHCKTYEGGPLNEPVIGIILKNALIALEGKDD
jgi:hypothetical protein